MPRVIVYSLTIYLYLALAATTWFTAAPALADIVNNDPAHYGIAGITNGSNFGQSFIATANELQVDTVSFMWGGSVNAIDNDPTITVNLRSGAGFAGSSLGSKMGSLIPDSTPAFTWIDFKFNSPITLTSGQTYTLDFSKQPVGFVSGSFVETSNLYPDGTLIFPGGAIPGNDLVFRVLSVPEPTTWVLFFLGGTGLLVARVRRGQQRHDSLAGCFR